MQSPGLGSGSGSEDWLSRPQARLQPTGERRTPRSRQASPALRAAKRGLDRAIDTLIVLVLVLFVLALGFWIYDTYVDPFLRRMSGSVPSPPRGSTSLWPSVGRLSSPEEAAQAPLPFVPYSTSVSMQNAGVPEPTAAPGTETPTWLEVPAIGLSTPVVEVTIQNGVWQVAEYAAGYHRGSARPGTVGNTVISGHKGLSGAVFARLDEVDVGDTIYLTAGSHEYQYQVVGKKSVWPSQVEVLAPSSTPVLTLITCTAYDTQRLIVLARLVQGYSIGTQP